MLASEPLGMPHTSSVGIPDGLHGTISKALLLVFPLAAETVDAASHPARGREETAAAYGRLIAATKDALCDEGFVIVREEERRLTAELLDSVFAADGFVASSSPSPPVSASGDTRRTAAAVIRRINATGAGSAVHVFVVARANCHAKLLDVLSDVANLLAFSAALTGVPQPNLMSPEDLTPVLAAVRDRLYAPSSASACAQAIRILFPAMLSHDIPSDVVAQELIDTQLRTALVSALTELAKVKPSEPLKWLAHHLLSTNQSMPHPLPSSE